jgi:hypothetical protein
MASDVPAGDASDPVDHGDFIIPNGLWLVGPKEHPKDIRFLCQSLVKMGCAEGTFVAAFTDEDLARRFLGRMPERDVLEPFRPATPNALASLLILLQALGHTHLAIDPELNHDQRTSIERLVAELTRGG